MRTGEQLPPSRIQLDGSYHKDIDFSMKQPPNAKEVQLREGPKFAAHFRGLLKLTLDGTEADAVGMVFVPQEGSEAGTISIFKTIAVEGSEDNADNLVSERLAQILNGAEFKDRFDSEFPNYLIQQLSGPFQTPIGYLWARPRTRRVESGLLEAERVILSEIANSKKSYFHDIFSKSIKILNDEAVDSEDGLFRILSNSIKAGLYCEEVIVWKRKKAFLISSDHPELSMPIARSLAGSALKMGVATYPNIKLIPKDTIQHAQWLGENGLNAFFLFPIKTFQHDDSDAPDEAVIGVFYKRPNGTTSIDRELCEYAIRFHETLWYLWKHNGELLEKATDYDLTFPFYKEAIRALADFHDIQTIFLGINPILGTIESYAPNRPELDLALRNLKKLIASLKEMVRRNQNAVTVASGMSKDIGEDDQEQVTLVRIRRLFDDQIDRIEGEGRLFGVEIERRYTVGFEEAYIRRLDFEAVLGNLLSNALRAVKLRGQPGSKIFVSASRAGEERKIKIKVRDNGPGIDPEIRDRIFEPHFTTHEADGGTGFGLTKVNSIALRHESKVEVESKWGLGATFEVTLRFREKRMPKLVK